VGRGFSRDISISKMKGALAPEVPAGETLSKAATNE
jgi:hypothetical protein